MLARIFTVVIAGCLLLNGSVGAEEPYRERTQRFLGHGTLRLKYPASWKESTKGGAGGVLWNELKPQQGESFEAAWFMFRVNPSYAHILTDEGLRKSFKQKRSQLDVEMDEILGPEPGLLDDYVEKSLSFVSFKGRQNEGVCVHLTRKAVTATDKFRYVTECRFRMDGLLGAVMIGTKDKGAAEERTLLDAFRVATIER